MHVAWCMDKESHLLQFGELVCWKQARTGENCVVKLSYPQVIWLVTLFLETVTLTPAEDSVLVGCCTVLFGVYFLTPARNAWHFETLGTNMPGSTVAHPRRESPGALPWKHQIWHWWLFMQFLKCGVMVHRSGLIQRLKFSGLLHSHNTGIFSSTVVRTWNILL